MRPLCGAIITAGALIGLGLFSLGYGTRYAAYQRNNEGIFDPEYYVRFRQMDTPLMVMLVFLLASLGIGLAIAFVGLAYHHHKRHHEMLRDHAAGAHLHTGIQLPK